MSLVPAADRHRGHARRNDSRLESRSYRLLRARDRGFTLVELILTVGIIGVLATLSIVGFRRLVHAAQSSEAKDVIGMIRAGEESYKADTFTYLGCSTNIHDFYPNASPNDRRMNWIQPSDARFTNSTNGWALLGVTSDSPVRFGYAVVAGVGGMPTAPDAFASPPTMPSLSAGVPWYTIQAKNDHDNNGVFAVFASVSTSGEIFSQNEQE